jgi:cyanophycin synthetase
VQPHLVSIPAPPFEDSRRLTGPNLYFAHAGAVLEALGARARDSEAHDVWRVRVAEACVGLGWSEPHLVVRVHASGAALALTAADDQLFTATEIDEWAWCATVDDGDPIGRFHAPGHPAVWDRDLAMRTLRLFSSAERRPDILALLQAASQRKLPVLLDDDALSIGLGRHGRTWPLATLPAPESVPWPVLGRIPTALVTGSNGKTTTVRVLAAMLRAYTLRTAHSCTDGLFVGGGNNIGLPGGGAGSSALERLESGDYSGPAGARQLLRRADVEAAVLETARGGMMRRGLALAKADVAVVTNISADHFGEYGIHSVEDLASVKLTVARAVAVQGWLVLNADDPLLRAQGPHAAARIAWFHLDTPREDDRDIAARAYLLEYASATGTPLCGVSGGRLRLRVRDAGAAHDEGAHDASPHDASTQGEKASDQAGFAEIDLGDIAAMPLTFGGEARHNIANLAAAALSAYLLGVPVQTIREVLADFGRDAADNPGRLQRWRLGGVGVLLDYAHNPDGLNGLLRIAQHLRGAHRMALLLGQAGNREDKDIRALAATAAVFAPDLVVLKDIDGYMRGRAAGEVAGILRDELLRHGIAETAMPVRLSEVDAVREALKWTREGDVLVLPVHGYAARDAIVAMLDRLQADSWQPGMPLPVV